MSTNCGRIVYVRTVRILDDETDDSDGEADRGGDTDDALDGRRGLPMFVAIVGNGVGPLTIAPLSWVAP